MSSDKVQDLIIVGAGISGLGFADLALKKGYRPLVLEASQHIGGCIDSYKFSTPEGDGWAELGAHTCFNSYGTLLGILEGLGQLGQFQDKDKLSYQLLTKDGLKSIPRALSFVEIIRSCYKIFTLDKKSSTVEQFFGAIVGPENFRRVVGPALDAVICQSASLFPADALFRKKPRRKEVQRSFTGSRGLQTFTDAIANQDNLNIRLSSPVNQVMKTEEGYQVQLFDGEVIRTKRLALATAPDITSQILEQSEPEISSLASEVEVAEIDSMMVVIGVGKSPLPKIAGIIAQSDHFYSAVSRDPIPDQNYRAFTFHFRPEQLTEVQMLEKACEVLEVPVKVVVDHQLKRNRLPKLRQGHGARIQQMDALLAGEPLAITGNWFDGVSIEDSLLRTATEVNRLFSD